MAKVQSKHGLERVYKTWRKGKSKNSNKAGSLKNQIRSKQRFLKKITDVEHQKKIQAEIDQLEAAIQSKQMVEKEKKIATKYHQAKFFERQKLLRLEKKAKKNLQEAKAAADFDDVEKYTGLLEQICMDQLYVAYFPNDTKYLSLFKAKQGEEGRREKIRKTIVTKIKSGHIDCSKSWVNMDLLKAKDFNIDMKNRIEYDEDGNNNDNQKDNGGDVVMGANRSLERDIKNMSKMATMVERKESSSDQNNDNDEKMAMDVDSREEKVDTKKKKDSKPRSKGIVDKAKKDGVPTVGKSDSDESSDSNDSNSSSSDSDSDSSSDSDSDSSSDSDEKQDIVPKTVDDKEEEESDDDFLIDNSNDKDMNVFAFAKKESEDDYNKKGDKSTGWKTQKQRPGEWKKRRER